MLALLKLLQLLDVIANQFPPQNDTILLYPSSVSAAVKKKSLKALGSYNGTSKE